MEKVPAGGIDEDEALRVAVVEVAGDADEAAHGRLACAHALAHGQHGAGGRRGAAACVEVEAEAERDFLPAHVGRTPYPDLGVGRLLAAEGVGPLVVAPDAHQVALARNLEDRIAPACDGRDLGRSFLVRVRRHRIGEPGGRRATVEALEAVDAPVALLAGLVVEAEREASGILGALDPRCGEVQAALSAPGPRNHPGHPMKPRPKKVPRS